MKTSKEYILRIFIYTTFLVGLIFFGSWTKKEIKVVCVGDSIRTNRPQTETSRTYWDDKKGCK